jgi:hypothetical protein
MIIKKAAFDPPQMSLAVDSTFKAAGSRDRFQKFDKKGQIYELVKAAAGFKVFKGTSDFIF